MLMRQEDWDIKKASEGWRDRECDFSIGQGIGEIRGIAVTLASLGKEDIAHELLDAAQYVECGYVRADEISRETAQQKHLPKKKTKEPSTKVYISQGGDGKIGLFKRTEEETAKLLERTIEGK